MLDNKTNYAESVIAIAEEIVKLCGQCHITKQSAWRWVGLPPKPISKIVSPKKQADYYYRLNKLRDFLQEEIDNGDMPKDLTVEWIKQYIGE